MSDKAKPESNDYTPSIQEWHLTAYALGELDEATAKTVEDWLSKNPESKQEIDAIRQIAQSVEQQLGTSQAELQLDETRTHRIKEAIASAAATTAASIPSIHQEDLLKKKIRQRRFLVAMTSGLAAGLAAIAFWMSRPYTGNEGLVTWIDRPAAPAAPASAGPMATPELPSTGRFAEKSDDIADGTLAGKRLPESLADDKWTEQEAVREKAAVDGLAPTTDAKDLSRSLAEGANSPAKDSAYYYFVPGSATGGMRGGMPIGGGGVGGLGGSGGGPGGIPAASGEGLARWRAKAAAEPMRSSTPESKLAPQLLEEEFGTEGNEGDLERDRRGLRPDRLSEFPEELKENVPSRLYAGLSKDRSSGDRFDSLPETPFVAATKEPFSTFSIDVDTASYSKLRQYVMESNVVPPPSTIRIEEWLNYFDYKYPGPLGDDPFAAHMKMGECPWNPKHKLVRVAIQAKKVANQERPKSNLVFLIDVSGSMADANKLPLVKRTLNILTTQLREQDRVAIVVYAGAAGCVLPSTDGQKTDQILAAINELQSGGSTNGGQGIELAYKIAQENFIPGGVNRVILCTDGDFNVGVTGTDALVSMMQEKAKSNIFLTCLGYGIGNYNDSMMEQVSNKGNGTYAMVDGESEARRIMTQQLSGTLMTVAKDVKIQIEFNPAKVHSYRLIGYENRRLAAADFNNDKKDAGEIGAGHRVTALYEIVPVGQEDSIPGAIDELRFGKNSNPSAANPATQNAGIESDRSGASNSEPSKDWLLLKIRSKQPESSQSTKQEFLLGEVASQLAYEGEQSDFDWATSIAEFGLLMRQSQLAPEMSWEKMLARAMDSTASDPYRLECIAIMQRAKALVGR